MLKGRCLAPIIVAATLLPFPSATFASNGPPQVDVTVTNTVPITGSVAVVEFPFQLSGDFDEFESHEYYAYARLDLPEDQRTVLEYISVTCQNSQDGSENDAFPYLWISTSGSLSSQVVPTGLEYKGSFDEGQHVWIGSSNLLFYAEPNTDPSGADLVLKIGHRNGSLNPHCKYFISGHLTGL